MRTDRYLKFILTVIAVELLWLGLNNLVPPVSAQAGAPIARSVRDGVEDAPTRVVITGVDGGFLPVAIAGQTVTAGRAPLQPLQTAISGAVAIETRAPLRIVADRPLKVESDRPLKVESVPYTPGLRPGD